MPGEVLAVADRLGALVLVVRELQVLAAAVDVEALAEQVERHDDALGVPARTPRPPRRVPRRLARLGLLPEDEVDRAALLLDRLHACARPQGVDRLAGEQAIVLDPLGLEVHAVGGLVGDAVLDEASDEIDHALDVGGRVRIVVGPFDAERVHGPVPHRLAALE